MNKASHFCAGIYLKRGQDGKYQILGATSRRFVEEVKLPGGTNENAAWENPEQTFKREFSEETGLTPTLFVLIHTESGRGHIKHYFVCQSVTGELKPKHDEPDGDKLTLKMWDLAEFNRHLFESHRVAFMKACIVLRRIDETFSKHYEEICERLDKGY
jgi:ADP-ribose pyrophosphatase YjhB (NUDIX family)